VFLVVVAAVALAAHLISRHNWPPHTDGDHDLPKKPPPRVPPSPGTVAPGWIGMRGSDVPGGVSVTAVYVGGPADRAGVVEGDVVVSVDGRSPATCADVGRAISVASIGSAIVLELGSRDGSRRTVRVTVDLATGVGQLVTETIEKGTVALAGLQQNGLWPSKRTRPGERRPDLAASALACAALSAVGPDAAGQARDALGTALERLRAVRSKDGSIEDPRRPGQRGWATTFLLFALARDRNASRAELEATREWLVRAQLWDGLDATDPRRGAWSDDGKPDGAELSLTAWTLEALATAGLPNESPAWERAAGFVARCQNLEVRARDERARGREAPLRDGGFAAAPGWSLAGRVAVGDSVVVPRSSGLATAEGANALRAIAASEDRDRRLAAATEWLGRSFALDRCPGFDPHDAVGWSSAFELHWLAALAKALAGGKISRVESRGQPHEWGPELARLLASRQEPAGWWVGGGQLDEDDPTVATSFALLALVAVRDNAGGGRTLRAAPNPPAPTQDAAPPSQDPVERGRRFFQSASLGCASCHLDRRGPLAPSLVGVADAYVTRARTREDAAKYLANLVRDSEQSPPLARSEWPTRMPAYAATTLSDPDLADLTAFIMSLTGRSPASEAGSPPR
jgi:mono/diheme cytochrome c family protein